MNSINRRLAESVAIVILITAGSIYADTQPQVSANAQQATAKGSKSEKPTVEKPTTTSKSKSAVTIPKATTRIVKRLNDDGDVDYLEALNQRSRAGVTPRNNAMILFWQAVGPAEIPKNVRKTYFQELGIEPLPADGDYFENIGQHVRRIVTDEPREGKQQALFRQHSAAMLRPWSEKEFP